MLCVSLIVSHTLSVPSGLHLYVQAIFWGRAHINAVVEVAPPHHGHIRHFHLTELQPIANSLAQLLKASGFYEDSERLCIEVWLNIYALKEVVHCCK